MSYLETVLYFSDTYESYNKTSMKKLTYETLPSLGFTKRDSGKSFLTTGVELLLLVLSSAELKLESFSLEQGDTPRSDPFELTDRLCKSRGALSFECDLHGLPLDL